ncbi:unnamed protein product [Protopolystoma xenopodis]|uniref:Uncharacterized protein n=1 Tax=Protopolystoma xenopodis TaxID=117903 RepID=A0A3S5C4C3_9PLAT|nr:unnamed protein product [Protopolystoma xenopodis]
MCNMGSVGMGNMGKMGNMMNVENIRNVDNIDNMGSVDIGNMGNLGTISNMVCLSVTPLGEGERRKRRNLPASARRSASSVGLPVFGVRCSVFGGRDGEERDWRPILYQKEKRDEAQLQADGAGCANGNEGAPAIVLCSKPATTGGVSNAYCARFPFACASSLWTAIHMSVQLPPGARTTAPSGRWAEPGLADQVEPELYAGWAHGEAWMHRRTNGFGGAASRIIDKVEVPLMASCHGAGDWAYRPDNWVLYSTGI